MTSQLAAIDALVVEDHGPTRKMLCEVLSVLGVGRVRAASSGGEALRALADHCPDILLVDWEMPGINGLDLVSFIRTSPDSPSQDMPIMMVSAHSTLERVLKAKDCGITEFLVKPIDARTLAIRLTNCLRLKQLPLHALPLPTTPVRDLATVLRSGPVPMATTSTAKQKKQPEDVWWI